MQRNLMVWQARDAIDVIELQGWYSGAELQRAFAAVVAEQDMLRAAPDTVPAQWRLLAAEAVAAATIPAIDLGAHDPARHDALLEKLGAELLAARRKTPLAYVAAVASLSDVDHRLALVVDHLVWDGMSAQVLQQRMQQHLAGRASAVGRNWRDHVEQAWRQPDAPTAALLDAEIDRAGPRRDDAVDLAGVADPRPPAAAEPAGAGAIRGG